MFSAIEAFQKSKGLRVDGVMKPQGETEEASQLIQALALQPGTESSRGVALSLQDMGRNGDTILAHITPEEAKMLKEQGGAGTINPQTGLLEFNDSDKKEGNYIWRTVGDDKVRSSHADRDGQTYSWDNPPDGGHPGEAQNCRCTAEEPNCTIPKMDLDEIDKQLMPVEGELGETKRKITNIKLDIEKNQDDISDLENAASILTIGGILTKIPHPLAKIVGYASEITAVMVAAKIREIEAELKANQAKLEKLESTKSKLKSKVQNLRNKKIIAQQAYDECMGK